MNKDINNTLFYRELINEFLSQVYPHPVARECVFPDISNKVKVALGMRRTGKTFLLFGKIQELLKKGIPREEILYINFEDERLLPLNALQLSSLIDTYYDLYPDHLQKKCFFFFDEIQNVNGWALFVRRFLDSGKADIYLTGSSAKLLSKEIASELRGRSFAIEVWPYSFTEYLTALGEELPTRTMAPIRQKKLKNKFETYLEQGGLPEVINVTTEERLVILQDYVSTVTYRDIVERHGMTNLSLLKYLIKTLINTAGNRFSANKFFRDIKSQGLPVGKNTVHDYLRFIEDAYLAFTVPLFTKNIRQQNVNPRKIFMIDTGLTVANSLRQSPNRGFMFENLIFLDLKRRRYEVSYILTKEGYEVDFAARALSGDLLLIQVCSDISNPETEARENRALQAAKKEFKAKGYLVTPQNYFEFLEVLKK